MIAIDTADFYVPTSKQEELHRAPERYIGFGGGIGGAKTVGLCMEAYLCMVEFPGNVGFIGRKIANHFYSTTFKTWERLIPKSLWDINEQKKEIYIKTAGQDSTLMYGGLTKREETTKFSGMELGFVGIDQAEELDADDFTGEHGILTRLRLKTKDGRQPFYRAVFTANPRQCAFKNLFIDSPIKDSKFIKALWRDNPHLPADYIPRIKELYKFRPELLEALLEGNWNIISDNNVVIKQAWIDSAVTKMTGIVHANKTGVCCDVARFGDDETVVYGLVGTKMVSQDIFQNSDTYSTAARCLKMAKDIGGNWIAVDGSGVGGGVVDALRHMIPDGDIMVFDYVGGSGADNSEMFYNKRAESWWRVSEMFKKGEISIMDDNELKKELSSVTYSFSSGRILMADKDDIKRVLGRSPDRADALIIGMSYLNGAPDRKMSAMEKIRIERREKLIENQLREQWLESNEFGSYQNNEINLNEK